jgi:hypothetical protein
VIRLQFTSRNPGYQLIVKQPVIDRSMGYERVVRPMIVADFAEQAVGVETYEGLEGGQPFTQVRGGGFFDTERAQKAHAWTDDERQLVEERLLEICENGPRADEIRMLTADIRPQGFGDIRVYETPKPVAPWPTYDEIHHERVAQMAADLGLAPQALVYEQRTKNRKTVVARLQDLLRFSRPRTS